MARDKLTDAALKSAAPGWHGDGDGLWLRVAPTGTRSWVFVWVRNGRRREMGLGGYGSGAAEVSLAAARDKAEQVRAILVRGGNPLSELPERQARSRHRTFGEVADEFLAVKQATFRNKKHAAQWRMTLTDYAAPLRNIPVSEIATGDLVRVLRPIWSSKHDTASRLRGRIEKVLDFAAATDLRSGGNPARWKGHLDGILGRREKLARGPHAAMPYRDVPAFMARLREANGFAASALELCILTATRTGEALQASWPEFDLGTQVWTIPPARTSAGRQHIVPLSRRLVELLAELSANRISIWVFPGASSRKPLSDMAMLMTMRRLGAAGFTVHGFRSAFRDWARAETTFPADVVEMALGLRLGEGREQAHRRAATVAKRRKLLDQWAEFVSSGKP